MTASYSFLATSVCVSSKWMCCTASLLQSTNKPFPMHVACHIHQMHLCSICKKNSRFGPSDGKSSTKLPQKGSSAGKEPHLWLTTHNLRIQNLFTHQGCMLQARNSGFLLAANRLREVRLAASSGLQDTSNSEKAVASSEKAAGSIDSPAGIPPQGSKPAGTKPDPKAKPFTPGI